MTMVRIRRPDARLAAFAVGLPLVALLVATGPSIPRGAVSGPPSGTSTGPSDGSSTPEAAGRVVRVVAPGGSDAAAGTTAAPWATLAHAVATAAPGDAILLRAGVYAGARIERSGLPGRPTVIGAYGDGPVTIDGGDGRARVVEIAGASDITLADLTIRGARERWGAGLWIERSARISVLRSGLVENRSFGAKVVASRDVHLSRLDVAGNETGVEAEGEVAGFALVDSAIHDHAAMLVDGQGGARGANATNFYHATGPALVARNRIWGNRARSSVFGFDGGAFEVYGSRGITYDGNELWDNQNVMELGTDGPPNAVRLLRTFARGSADGTAPVPGPSQGILLRACDPCLIAANTLIDLDDWTLLLVDRDHSGGRRNAGVRFTGNLVRQLAGIALAGGDWSGATTDHDRFWLLGGGLGRPLGTGDTMGPGGPLDDDFRPLAGSPLIDGAVPIPGAVERWSGAAPDIGWAEAGLPLDTVVQDPAAAAPPRLYPAAT